MIAPGRAEDTCPALLGSSVPDIHFAEAAVRRVRHAR